MKYDVLGLGNALLDYQVEVPFEFLEKKSLKKGSMTLVDAETQHAIISEIEKLFGTAAIQMTSGGCAANTLAGLSNYGGSSYFVGKISSDPQGEHYSSDLKNARVHSGLHIGSTERTGTCLALITPDAERTMLTHLGIATHLSESDIDAEKIEASDLVYIEGYLWDPPSGRSASKRAIEIAKQKQKKVSLTFADSFCVERHFSDFIDLAKNHVDVLFCNETEAIRATQSHDADEALRIIKDWSPIVCVTLGPRGAFISDRENGIAEEIATWDVQLVDKLGAGDLFASGVLFGLSQKKSLREAGLLGCYSATRVIQQMSARLTERLADQIEVALQGPSPRIRAAIA